jgi:hypothetical protein
MDNGKEKGPQAGPSEVLFCGIAAGRKPVAQTSVS